MSTWLFIGSSATAPEALRLARERHAIDCTITCNAGLALVPVPTVYVCVDHVASRRYYEQARYAAANGTHTVTIRRDERALRERQLDQYAERLTLPGHGEPTRETWGSFRYSGPLCMEYALRHGATRLVLVGCDGYRHGDAHDYFDGKYRRPINPRTATGEVLVPRTRLLCRLWPETQWTVYGSLAYAINEPNWHVVPCGP